MHTLSAIWCLLNRAPGLTLRESGATGSRYRVTPSPARRPPSVRATITTDPEDLRGYSSLDPDEGELLRRLRTGDEEAFACLVDRHHAAMVRLARGYVRSPAVAEEVAQDAWLGLLRGLDRFEGRSSLRTWLFRIVVNRAISAGLHERQHLPVDDSELGDDRPRYFRNSFLNSAQDRVLATSRAWRPARRA